MNADRTNQKNIIDGGAKPGAACANPMSLVRPSLPPLAYIHSAAATRKVRLRGMDKLTNNQDYITSSSDSSPAGQATTLYRPREQASKEEAASLPDNGGLSDTQLAINKLDDKVGDLKLIVKRQELDKYSHAMYECQRDLELEEKGKKYDELLTAVCMVANGNEEVKRMFEEIGFVFA